MYRREGIRTNYIGNRELHGELKCVIISNVGVNIPGWIKDKSLAPRYSDVQDIKSGRITWEQFRDNYYEFILSKHNPKDIYEKYSGWYLLCCEKDHTFCHRTILAKWLESNGFEAKEGLFN